MTAEELATALYHLEKRVEKLEATVKVHANRLGVSSRPNCRKCGRLLSRPNAEKCSFCGEVV